MGFRDRGGLWLLPQGALLVGIVIALMSGGFDAAPVVVVLGWAVAGLGAGFGLAGMLYLGGNLSPFPAPLPGAELVDRGPYRMVRHPIYTGLILGGLGLATADGNWPAALMTAALTGVLAAKAGHEEGRMRRQLDGYSAYAVRVRWRLLPGVW